MLENILDQIIGCVNDFIPGWLITVGKVFFYIILAVVVYHLLSIALHLLMRFVAGVLNICLRIVKEIFPYALGIGIVGYLGRYVWRKFSIGEHLAAFHIDVHSIWEWLQGSGVVAFFEYAILILVGGFIVLRFVILFFRFGWLDFLTDNLIGGSSGYGGSTSSSRSRRSYDDDDDFSTRPCSSDADGDARREREAEEEAERRHREKINDARREKEWETAMHNLYGEEDSARRAREAAEREEELRNSSW